MPVRAHDDVLGLQVAVHDALLVRRRETLRDLERDADRARDRERAADDAVPQRLALQELHHRVGDAVLAAVVVQREDVRMGQRGDGARLALEAGEGLRIARDALRQDLDGHLAPEPRVARPVDLPHSSRSEA